MLGEFLYGVYTAVSSVMFVYGLNFYYLTYRSTRNTPKAPPARSLAFPT